MRPVGFGWMRFAQDDSGATMMEYGLLLILIAVVVIAAAKVLGQSILPLYNLSQYF
jgi:Flp pilus assembly pilin Flp